MHSTGRLNHNCTAQVNSAAASVNRRIQPHMLQQDRGHMAQENVQEDVACVNASALAGALQ
eukprot:1158723-Pelagomonas_calceolata.AAC.5